MPDYVSSTAKLFADDTKVYNVISSPQDCETLQNDLNNLSAWSKTWLLRFNASKCVVLKIKQCLKYSYTLNGVLLNNVKTQKDLGVFISDDLTPTAHVSSIVKKCNQRLGLIRRCFTDLTANKVQILYQSLIRPVLEYGSPSWSPWFKKDIDALEKVQRRCLRLTHEKIELPKLITRRQELDLCEVYKYLHGLYKTPAEVYFKTPERTLRGHSWKLYKPQDRTNVRHHFFSHRVIDAWNNLPEHVVSASSLGAFKRNLRSLPVGEEG